MNQGFYGFPRAMPENGVVARASHDTTQSLLNNTSTYIVFNTTVIDTMGGMHHPVVNSGRLTAPYAGIYMVIGTGRFVAHATGGREVDIVKNRNQYIAHGSAGGISGMPTMLCVSTIIQMNDGDFVELLVTQTSGTTLNMEPGAAGAAGISISMWRIG